MVLPSRLVTSPAALVTTLMPAWVVGRLLLVGTVLVLLAVEPPSVVLPPLAWQENLLRRPLWGWLERGLGVRGRLVGWCI